MRLVGPPLSFKSIFFLNLLHTRSNSIIFPLKSAKYQYEIGYIWNKEQYVDFLYEEEKLSIDQIINLFFMEKFNEELLMFI